MKTWHPAAIVLLAGMNIATTTYASELVQNGGFESPVFTEAPYYRYMVNGDSTTIPFWTAENDDGIGEYPYLFNVVGYGGNVAAGLNSVQLNQGSGLSTHVALTAGQSYKLSFIAIGGGNLPISPLDVSIGTVTTTASSSPTEQSFFFVAPATDSAAVLRFFNPSPAPDFRAYVLDGVSLTSVPLPAALPLFALPLAGVAARAFRKRTAS